MNESHKLEKLRRMVEDSAKINEQLKMILGKLNNLEDVIANGESISDRVSKAFTLYLEFTEILKD